MLSIRMREKVIVGGGLLGTCVASNRQQQRLYRLCWIKQMETMLAKSQINPSPSMMFSLTKTHHLTNHPFLLGPQQLLLCSPWKTSLQRKFALSWSLVWVKHLLVLMKSHTVYYEKLVQEWWNLWLAFSRKLLLLDVSLVNGRLLWNIPVFKGGRKDRRLPVNYRPISLTTCVARVLENIVNKRLQGYRNNCARMTCSTNTSQDSSGALNDNPTVLLNTPLADGFGQKSGCSCSVAWPQQGIWLCFNARPLTQIVGCWIIQWCLDLVLIFSQWQTAMRTTWGAEILVANHKVRDTPGYCAGSNAFPHLYQWLAWLHKKWLFNICRWLNCVCHGIA